MWHCGCQECDSQCMLGTCWLVDVFSLSLGVAIRHLGLSYYFGAAFWTCRTQENCICRVRLKDSVESVQVNTNDTATCTDKVHAWLSHLYNTVNMFIFLKYRWNVLIIKIHVNSSLHSNVLILMISFWFVLQVFRKSDDVRWYLLFEYKSSLLTCLNVTGPKTSLTYCQTCCR